MTTTSGSIQFDFGALLKQAWKLFTENIGLLLGCIVVLAVISVVTQQLAIPIVGHFRLNVINLVIMGPLMLGFVTILLKIVRRQNPVFAELFSGFARFLPSFVAYLLITIFAMIGLALCVIPGLFVAVIYMLTFYYLYDENLDFWPAMERSRTTVMANLGQFILLFLVLLAMNLVGLCACIVGLLVSAPVSMLMVALAYDQVTGRRATVTAEPTPMQ